MITEQHRYRGALLGLACGDAIGAAVQSQPRGSFAELDDMTGGGPFGLKPGEWTAHTSMALCLAHSLVEMGGFDPADQMNRYGSWQDDGYMSSTGKCIDIDENTATALRKYREASDPFAAATDPGSAGSGALARLAPVPMYYALDADATMRQSVETTRTTHGATEAFECSALLGLLVREALLGRTKDAVLAVAYPGILSPNVEALTRGAYTEKSVEQISGGGDAVAALEAALWCFWHTSSFKTAVLQAANLGDDADTTAAIVGQLAGAYYGVQEIPEVWLDQLAMQQEIISLADRLLAERHDPNGQAPAL